MTSQGTGLPLVVTPTTTTSWREILAVTPETVGALIFMFEVQTLFAGGLWGIDPLDQPGVEEGKEFTYALMGRPGFDKKKEEFERSSLGVQRCFL